MSNLNYASKSPGSSVRFPEVGSKCTSVGPEEHNTSTVALSYNALERKLCGIHEVRLTGHTHRSRIQLAELSFLHATAIFDILELGIIVSVRV
jgi:hypothetical protein